MPDGLYDRDVLAWAAEQADLLRRLANGEGVNDAVDWPNVIEEVNDVGQSILRSCRGLLQQGMLHLVKLHAWPESTSVTAWRTEVGAFLDGAEVHFVPSMRQWIELDVLYMKALRRAAQAADASGAPRSWPSACPFSLDELLEGDVDALLLKIEMAGSHD